MGANGGGFMDGIQALGVKCHLTDSKKYADAYLNEYNYCFLISLIDI